MSRRFPGGKGELMFRSKIFDVAYTPGHASHHVSYFGQLKRRRLRW
ncbi:MAG: hypothetical protein Ct9H300mP25_05060 [Acidobacteriota bacterium]|nr:MAG: hypothetical protein Ct9H300mP25_05060 [Acidobacteriota bacterium]